MKRVFKFRITNEQGEPQSAYSSGYRSLNAVLKAVKEYQSQYHGVFNRPSHRIQITEFTK